MAFSNPSFPMPIKLPFDFSSREPSPECDDPSDDADESESKLSEDKLVPVPCDDDSTEESSISLGDLLSDAPCARMVG